MLHGQSHTSPRASSSGARAVDADSRAYMTAALAPVEGYSFAAVLAPSVSAANHGRTSCSASCLCSHGGHEIGASAVLQTDSTNGPNVAGSSATVWNDPQTAGLVNAKPAASPLLSYHE